MKDYWDEFVSWRDEFTDTEEKLSLRKLVSSSNGREESLFFLSYQDTLSLTNQEEWNWVIATYAEECV